MSNYSVVNPNDTTPNRRIYIIGVDGIDVYDANYRGHSDELHDTLHRTGTYWLREDSSADRADAMFHYGVVIVVAEDNAKAINSAHDYLINTSCLLSRLSDFAMPKPPS